MDASAYEMKLNELIAGSELQRKLMKVSSEDFTESFTQ